MLRLSEAQGLRLRSVNPSGAPVVDVALRLLLRQVPAHLASNTLGTPAAILADLGWTETCASQLGPAIVLSCLDPQ